MVLDIILQQDEEDDENNNSEELPRTEEQQQPEEAPGEAPTSDNDNTKVCSDDPNVWLEVVLLVAVFAC